MKCINCKNLGKLKDEDGVPYDWCEKVCDNPDIHAERKCKHYITATNADRFRAMTDEELAEWISGQIDCEVCRLDYGGGERPCDNRCCLDFWLDWLREDCET